MGSTKIWIVCFIFLFTKAGYGQRTKSVKELEEAEGLMQLTLKSLGGMLDFFKREYRDVNLDAIIGTRLVEGELGVLLRRIDDDAESWPIDGATLQHIRDLQKLAGDISDESIPYLKVSDPVYYQRIYPLVQKNFWTLDFTSKDFTKADFYDAWIPKEGEALKEIQSDNCITELFGTGPNTKAKCHISAECWDLMTRPGYNGYSLTHQVFYLQIAYRMGCMEEMNKQRILLEQPPPSKLVDRFCAAVYLEAKHIDRAGFPRTKRDLFMEQAALCGMMGFRWFFSEEWLQAIISWQDHNIGCYIRDTPLQTESDLQTSSGGRVKREERLLDNGCLCHETTVAAGALANYIRYIAEYQQVTFQRNQIFA